MSTTTDTSAPLRPAPSVALVEALDRQIGFDARTRQGLSNHLPMELVALDALGAPAERLHDMLDRWVTAMLDPRRDPTVFGAFRAEIAADGIDATVARHLPRFAESPSSEWFHSMIRLAYALDAGHEGQVASALADWSTYERVLPGEPPEGGDLPALEVVRRLRAAGLDRGPSHADLRTPVRQDRFRELVAGIVVDDSLDDAAAAVAAAHVGGGNLATLHLVTGVQAARTVSRLTRGSTTRRFARRVVQAAAAGYVAAGAAPVPSDEALDGLRAVPVPDWDEVRAAAVASPDVHVTKLVYTCRTELAATADPLYSWLAARAVGLVTAS
jgi:hypothetical protein